MKKIITKYNKRISEILSKQKGMIFDNQWVALESERLTLKNVMSDLRDSKILENFYKWVDSNYALGMLTENIDEVINGYLKESDGSQPQLKNGKLPIPHVVGLSEQLKAFAKFLYDKEYLVRRSIDEAIEEFEKSL